MPAYVSHTIMARDVYNRINNKNVSLSYMLTYSLGGDLCKYSKCRYDSHHIKQDEFIYNICDYMKEHDLINDSECLGFLYGHICHLVMDNTIHPLIRCIDKNCIKNTSKIKSNHTLIELYYDNYFTNKKCNVRLDKYNYKEIFKAKTNKKISKLINSVYDKTYNCKNVSKYYKYNLWLYKKVRYFFKIFSFNFLKSVTGIKKFLINNKNINLSNDDRSINYNINNKSYNDNLDSLYELSVKEAVKYINRVDNYLKNSVK